MRRYLLILLFGLFVLPAGNAIAEGASPVRFAPLVQIDRKDTAGPLDLTRVTFGQQDTQLMLTLRSASAWTPARFAAKDGRSLCVAIFPGRATRPHLHICVGDAAGKPVLVRTRVDTGGHDSAARTISAFVGRPDERTVSAAFTPLAAGLSRGAFTWQVESHWVGGTDCPAPAGCVDAVPQHARVHDRIRLLAEPWCFGAAARDPLRPCANPALRTAVVPTPLNARITPNAYCLPTSRVGLVGPCAFGADEAQAVGTIALVGDSHAGHWRGAMEVVAQAKRWRGLSMTHTSCPLTAARPTLPTAFRSDQCVQWNREMLAWFGRHPEVHTVFVSAHPARFPTGAAAGYRAAWRRLPASVKHVFVIRDTPRQVAGQTGCINGARARHRSASALCTVPRRDALPSDPEASAVYGAHDPRVRVLDLSRYFCSLSRCFTVVGGVLVLKDSGHITRTFSTTLGPYLLRAVGTLHD